MTFVQNTIYRLRSFFLKVSRLIFKIFLPFPTGPALSFTTLSCLVPMARTHEGQHVRAALFLPVPSRPTPTTTRFLVLSYFVLFCLVLSCLVLSCHILSCLVFSRLIFACLFSIFYPSIASTKGST